MKALDMVAPNDNTIETQNYSVQVSISVPNNSLSLPPAIAVVTLTVIVWNPVTIKKALIITSLSATPIQKSIPSVMANTGKLLKVENSGSVLYDSSENSNERATSYKGFSWAQYNSSIFEVKTLTRTVEQFFMYMENDVFLLVVVALNDPPSTTIFIPANPSGPSTQPNHDLIEDFLPTMRDQLVELGIVSGAEITGSSPTSYYDLSNFTLTVGNNQTAVLRATQFNNVIIPIIATFTYNVKEVGPPTPIGNDLTFITPINKILKIKSTEASYDSVLTCTSLDQSYSYVSGTTTITGRNKATNVSDGIELIFGTTAANASASTTTLIDQSGATVPSTANATTSMYDIRCTLTRQGVSDLNFTIHVLAYDPADTTEEPPITIYTTTLQLPSFSRAITSYIYNGVNYGILQSTHIKITQTGTSGPYNLLTVTMDKVDPRIAFTVQTEDGKFYIYDVSYVEPVPTNAKFFQFVGEQNTITASMITTVDPGSLLPFGADLSSLLLSSGVYYALSESGVQVASVANNTINLSATLTSLAPGVCSNLMFMLTVDPSKPPLVFKPYIEVLGSPIAEPQDVIIEKGTVVRLKMTAYILNNSTDTNGSSNFAFQPASVTWLSSSSPSTTIPTVLSSNGPFSFEGNILVSSALPMSGTYVVSVDVLDRRRPDPAHKDTLVITIVVMEDTIGSVTELLVIGTQVQEVALLAPVAKVQIGSDSVVIPTTGTITLAGISFKSGATPDILVMQALVTNLQPLSILVFASNGKRQVLNITQISSLKDISLSSFEYVGNVFNSSTSGNTVVSFTYSSTISQPGSYSGTLPAGQTLVIGFDGVYNIVLNQQSTITVTYKTANSTETSTLSLEVNGQQHKSMVIRRYPDPTLNLGGSPIELRVQGSPLDESAVLDLGYAKLRYLGTTLTVTDVSSDFFRHVDPVADRDCWEVHHRKHNPHSS